ncbi:penicillin-binding protein [Methylobacterium sp. 092160098-2]|uniref:penicillin-binding protein n=1 Tax=Methylobacterium sp. 092160098-2 TaxID=3025129 RepID=UPI00238197A8|nr:penicillin-binding protein [Methylobacterium sp. 092160098-2]MDE4915258.1 penicillin-binding protein [Methylobacterium sp. 092160098-2]
MNALLTRRSALTAALVLAAYRSVPAVADPFTVAIRRARAADAACREAGRFARDIQAAGLPLPADWRAYRIGLALARTAARSELHALTPTTPKAAAALVAYYQQRAEVSDDPAVIRAARRRLRKVAQRPGAAALDVTPLARASLS